LQKLDGRQVAGFDLRFSPIMPYRRLMRRHIFEGQKAYVEEYFAKDVESELGLSQTKLIRLAMLLGSDYTEGVNGIGRYLIVMLPPVCVNHLFAAMVGILGMLSGTLIDS
jgi:hypothetical protein